MKLKTTLPTALLFFSAVAGADDQSTGDYPAMELLWNGPATTLDGAALGPCSIREYQVHWGQAAPAGGPDGLTNLVVSPVVCDEQGVVTDDGTTVKFDITDLPKEEGTYYREAKVTVVLYNGMKSVPSQPISLAYNVDGSGGMPEPVTNLNASSECPEGWMCYTVGGGQ